MFNGFKFWVEGFGIWVEIYEIVGFLFCFGIWDLFDWFRVWIYFYDVELLGGFFIGDFF